MDKLGSKTVNNSHEAFFQQHQNTNLDQNIKARSSTMLNLMDTKCMFGSVASKVHSRARKSLKNEDHWIDDEHDSADQIDFNSNPHGEINENMD